MEKKLSSRKSGRYLAAKKQACISKKQGAFKFFYNIKHYIFKHHLPQKLFAAAAYFNAPKTAF